MIIVFQLVLMQAVANYVQDELVSSVSTVGATDDMGLMIEEHFSSFSKFFGTLLMSISGGAEWGKFFKVFMKIGGGHGAVFVTYILVVTFGVLNVITGIFVETATEHARTDFELAKEAEAEKNMKSTVQLLKLFHAFDKDSTGTISLEEWRDLASSPDVRLCFAMLDINLSRADEIFYMIASDSNDEVTLEEFVSGLLALRGGASSVDIAVLVRSTQALLRKFKAVANQVEDVVDVLTRFNNVNQLHVAYV